MIKNLFKQICQLKKKLTALKYFWKILRGIVTIVSILGGFLGYLTLTPQISLNPSFILDPKNPFLTPFVLENNGLFSIYKISTETKLLYVIDSRNNKFINVSLNSKVNDSLKLKSNRQTSLDIDIKPFISGLGLPFQDALIEVVIKYKPSIFYWERQETFRFELKKNSSGESLWLPTNKESQNNPCN